MSSQTNDRPLATAMVYMIRLKTVRAYLAGGHYAQAASLLNKYGDFDATTQVLPDSVDNFLKVNILMADIMLGLDFYRESIAHINSAIEYLQRYILQQIIVANRLLNFGVEDIGALDVLPADCKWLIAREICDGL